MRSTNYPKEDLGPGVQLEGIDEAGTLHLAAPCRVKVTAGKD